MWDLWWTKSHWKRFLSKFFGLPFHRDSPDYVSRGGWTTGQSMATVQTRGLTPLTWTTTKACTIGVRFLGLLSWLPRPDQFAAHLTLHVKKFWSKVAEDKLKLVHTIKTVSTSIILFRSQYTYTISRHVSVVINHFQVNHFLKTLLTLMYSLVWRYYPNF
jgi:hypothetical protein